MLVSEVPRKVPQSLPTLSNAAYCFLKHRNAKIGIIIGDFSYFERVRCATIRVTDLVRSGQNGRVEALDLDGDVMTVTDTVITTVLFKSLLRAAVV